MTLSAIRDKPKPLDDYLEKIRQASAMLSQLQVMAERCNDALAEVDHIQFVTGDPEKEPKINFAPSKKKMFYSTEELADELGVDNRKIGWLRKYGLLRAVQIGKAYRYYVADIEDFVRQYGDYDLSNEEKIEMAGALQRVRIQQEEKEKRRLSKQSRLR